MPTTAKLSNKQLKRLRQQAAAVQQQRSVDKVTAFRSEEHYWKNRAIQPDWAKAFCLDSKDILWDYENTSSGAHGSWTDRSGDSWKLRKIDLDQGGEVAVVFQDLPGFVFLPSCLSVPEQADLVTACLHETTTTATRSNLDTHYVAPPSGWWAEYVKSPDTVIQPRSREACGSNNDTNRFPEVRVQVDLPEMNQENFEKETCGTSLQDLEHIGKADPPPGENIVATPLHRLIRKLRWTIIGLEYHWGTKSYKWDRPSMPMPQCISHTASRIVKSVSWCKVYQNLAGQEALFFDRWSEEYKAEAGVVNFYQYQDTLTAHVDQSEVDSVRPLVSISLGESAIFLVGGKTRETTPIPILLRSGDVVIMSGPSRRVFHGVPRIIEREHSPALKPPPDHAALSQAFTSPDAPQIRAFMQGTRINVNVRQVFSG